MSTATTTTTTKVTKMSSPQTTGPQVRTTTTEQTGIHYSTIYLHTVPGTLKCICMIFTLLGFLCVLFSDFKSSGVCQFFSTITMIAFWFSGILLVLYLFHVIYVMSKIPWTKIEFFFCVGAVLFLALTSALIVGKQDKWLIAGGFFGFVAMVAYGYDAFLKYRMYNMVVTNVVTRTTTVTMA